MPAQADLHPLQEAVAGAQLLFQGLEEKRARAQLPPRMKS